MPITSTTQQQATLSLAAVTPGNSAIGDTATAGTSGSVARADHVHGREAAATAGASAVGDTAAAGSATTVARSDHRHSREAFGTPVTVNGQTTSLSAGSLTTVARADHVHTLSNVGSTLIYSTTLGGAASSIAISNIPQTYLHLMLIVTAKSTYASAYYDYIALNANSDTMSGNTNYIRHAVTQAYAMVGPINAAGNYRNQAYGTVSYIYNYTSTAEKAIFTLAHFNASASTNNLGWGIDCDVYTPATAITALTLRMDTGSNYATGATVRLYGLL